ncbi:MAG: aspartate--tRNA ligase [Candidatus Eremiobacteraeota bacterium]|nr:aspartate--tRNA ligase [Candidatus Eremiobacteraeota bacterium]MBC5827179.1 aspartate--tRNA ligase [Candidatus Eremiobacteraeota bacterium]
MKNSAVGPLHRDCGSLHPQDEGTEVEIRGWVNSTRDHGGLIFVDVRDSSGIAQAVADPRTAPEAAAAASSLRSEDVVALRGAVRRRPTGTENPKLTSGDTEVALDSVSILNRSLTPPFPVHGEADVEEGLRLKYRYLDLRRPHMQRNLALRHRAIKAVRDYLDEQGFLEIETPMLIKQTPEGARDFLVPSRLHGGQFYALPQSPQLFKQLLMVAGFGRYFQIARCFRDEDARSDRQPEFTQIDLEMAFPTIEGVIAVVEGMLAHMFRQALAVDVGAPFRRLSHADAMARYGSDKPDLRFGMELIEVTPAFEGTQFKVFAAAVQAGESIVGVVDEGGAARSRRDFDALARVAAEWGAKGLAWIAFTPDGLKSSLPKAALETQTIDRLGALTHAKQGDAVLMVAAERTEARTLAGKMRLHLAAQNNLRDARRFEFCWVLDFPLFEINPEGGIGPMHHPFTAPAVGSESLPGDPLSLRAQHYDVVLNGSELGSGSIRIHDAALQRRIFAMLGYPEDEVAERFGFLLEALAFGAPPHGGMALGVDRIVQIMVGAESIREVIAFPKNQRFQDLMMQAPARVPKALLDELRLRVDLPPAPPVSQRS